MPDARTNAWPLMARPFVTISLLLLLVVAVTIVALALRRLMPPVALRASAPVSFQGHPLDLTIVPGLWLVPEGEANADIRFFEHAALADGALQKFDAALSGRQRLPVRMVEYLLVDCKGPTVLADLCHLSSTTEWTTSLIYTALETLVPEADFGRLAPIPARVVHTDGRLQWEKEGGVYLAIENGNVECFGPVNTRWQCKARLRESPTIGFEGGFTVRQGFTETDLRTMAAAVKTFASNLLDRKSVV